jgi:hypothetical protein
MTEDGPMSAGALLTNFVEDEREGFDARDGNILAMYAKAIAERVAYLEITADDYEAANKRYGDSLQRFYAASEAEWQRLGDRSSSRAATAEEQELSDESGRDGLTVYLRIETFYVFAKILLDLVAGFVPYYFGPGSGVKLSRHSQLVKGALPKLAEQKGLTPVPSRLTELVAELGERVSDYRDKTVSTARQMRQQRKMARRRSPQRDRLCCLIGHQPDYTRTTQAVAGGSRSQPVTPVRPPRKCLL